MRPNQPTPERRKVIGLDFDNTIVTYDEVFVAEARQRGLIGSIGDGASKKSVRDAIRRLPNGEAKWQELQGFVYGVGISHARMFDGVDAFLRRCRDAGHEVRIVSHKTRYGHFDPTGTDLRQAALDWMAAHGLLHADGFGIDCRDIYFEDDRAAKLNRIAALGCTHFIDDLEEVLSDPLFPPTVERILFSQSGEPEGTRPYRSYATWKDLAAGFFPAPAKMHSVTSSAGGARGQTSLVTQTAVAARLIGAPLDDIETVGGGRNSRVYRVRSAGRQFALKQYLSTPDDQRDRLGIEVEALQLMERGGLGAVPRLVGFDREGGFVLMTWISGAAVAAVSEPDIDQALAFLAHLHGLARVSGFPQSQLASESCLCGAEIVRQIDSRLDRLRALSASEPQLGAFLGGAYAQAYQRVVGAARTKAQDAGLDFSAVLPHEKQSLVPSDFGFHNCLRDANGSLAFVDFEYFGWDDPVKLSADFLFHPGTPVGEAERRRFRRGAEDLYGADPAFGARLAAFLPLFGLRWVLILLNEFLPDRWERRVLAGDADSWPEAKARQLRRATDLLRMVESTG